MPVTITPDASSTGCTFVGGVVGFNSLGTCVLTADQPSDATHESVTPCPAGAGDHPVPPTRNWTGPNLSADVSACPARCSTGRSISPHGLRACRGFGNRELQVVNMTDQQRSLQGCLSPDGKTLSSNYQGIDILLERPRRRG